MIVRPCLVALAVACGCTREPTTPAPSEGAARGAQARATVASSPAPSSTSSAPAAPAPPPQLDPDGDDDPTPTGEGPLPARAHFEKVGKPPLALRMICDLTPLGDALYAAHSFQPLGLDGATITRYRPHEEAKKAFSVAFDWNRPGEPTKGGGAGQGFLRVHRIGGRLFVPDADPPYNGFGISEFGTEGFVFLSSSTGEFARARLPGHRPPGPPNVDGQPGAAVLPRAYHVIDAIRFRGRLYAATGSVPPKQAAWRGPSPGALHVASPDLTRWTYEIDYPYPWQNGVWRLTFLVRFRDRLYAGIQDYDGREPNDYVYFSPPAEASAIGRADVHPARVTPLGAAQTLRWFADQGRLFWIAWSRDGVRLRVTRDGDHWSPVELPPDVGAPTDITRFRGALVVLTEWALVVLRDGTTPLVIATVNDKKSPFELRDIFCGAPLAVFENALYAGGQRDGSLYRLVEDEPGGAR
jgi:hypothetical protein